METDLEEYCNTSILHYTDSQAAEKIITFRSRNSEIQSMVFDIVIQARLYGILLAAR